MPYGKKSGGYSGRNSGGYGRRDDDRPRYGSKPNFNNRSFDRGGSRGPKQMHDATCGNCGNDCQVPFRPTGDKPVLCSNCFDKNRGESRGRSERPFKKEFSAPKPDPRIDELKAELRSVQSKLDRIINMMDDTTVAPNADEDVSFSDMSEPLATPKKKATKAAPKKKATTKKAVAKTTKKKVVKKK